MAERDSNIDLLFRNGLSNYEALPPPDLWQQIKPGIHIPKRSIVRFRVAASVALLVGSGLMLAFFIRNIPSEIENNTVALIRPVQPVQQGQIPGVNNSPLSQSAVTQVIAKNETSLEIVENADPAVAPVYYFTLPEPGLYTPFSQNTQARRKGGNELPGSLQQAYNPVYSDLSSEAGVMVNENEPTKENKWSVGAMITPAFYSQFDLSGNSSEKELTAQEEGAFSYTGGFAVAYNLNKRFTVQTGINYSSIGQRIEGISSYSGFARYITSKGVSVFGVRTSSGTIAENNSDIFLADNNPGSRIISYYTRDVFDPVKNELSYISNNLTQNFNYLEVPVLLKYKLVDRIVDLKVIGGVSYNILVSNSAWSTSGGTRYIIGKTEGLNPVTVSSSLGMGMEYSFSGSFSFNIEPTFRYYITSPGGFSGPSIHPYSFGILTGVSYKF